MTEQQQPQNPQQPPAGYYPPPVKKSHTLRNVLLVITGLFVLTIGGCLAVVGVAANEVSKSVDKSIAKDNEPGGPNSPMPIQEGKAFEVSGFEYQAGWTVRKDVLGMVDIKGLKVANNRDSKDSALIEIKFMSGTEVLALSDCTTEPITVGTTVTLSCFSADKLPAKYDTITINDSF